MTAPRILVEILTLVLSGVTLLLILGAAAVRATRHGRTARRHRAEVVARPIILHALDEAADNSSSSGLSRSIGRCLDSTASALAAQLRGADREALNALLRERGTIDTVCRGTRSRRAIKRLRSVELLGSTGAPEGVLALIRRLDDHNGEVRRAAVRAAGRSAAVEALPQLLAMAERHDASASRHSVTLAVFRMGPAAAPALMAILADDARADRARAVAAQVLGWWGHLGAVDTLCAVLETGSAELRVAALDALGRIGAPASADAVAARLAPEHPVDLRVAAVRALGRLGDPSASGALGRLLAEEHDVARAAAGALTQLGARGKGVLDAVADRIVEAEEAVAYTSAGGWAPPARLVVPQ